MGGVLRGLRLGDLAADPRLATNNDRVRARDWLMPLLRERLGGCSAAELPRCSSATACPSRRSRGPEELFDDPHLLATGGLAPITLPDGRATQDACCCR